MEKGQVNTTVDIKINKEDVFQLILVEKEEAIKADLLVMKTNLDALKKTYQENMRNIEAEVIKDNTFGVSVSPSDMKSTHMFEDIEDEQICYLKNDGPDIYTLKNLDRLAEVANPMKPGRSHNFDVHFIKNKITLCNECSIYYEQDIKGFTGTLRKSIKIKKSPYSKKIAKLNIIKNKIRILGQEENELKAYLIKLPFDKTLKTAFLKKIIKSKDITKLLK